MNVDFARRALLVMPRKITLMLVSCVALIAGNVIGTWLNLGDIEDATTKTNISWSVIDQIRGVESRLATAESSQRGYLLTGNATYLAGYEQARIELPSLLRQLDTLVASDPQQVARMQRLRAYVDAKFNELKQTVKLVESRRAEQALSIVQTDTGKHTMDDATHLLNEMEMSARLKLLARNGRTLAQFRNAANVGFAIGTITLAVLLLFYGYIVSNARRLQETETLLRAARDSLESKVVLRTAQLSHLSRHLLQVAEAEKSALANELHDELGSNLTAINLDVSSVATRLKSQQPALADRLERSLRLLHETVDIKRRLIQGLRPSMLDSLGLCAAMRMHCEDFTRRTNLPCDADCPDDFPDVDAAWSIAMFRVAQEALNNTAKYANAKRVRVILRAEQDGVVLKIIDDGVGIDPDATVKPMSHGLLGMRERIAQIGGQLTVRRGDDGIGTIVDAFVPFSRSASSY
jgi:signal transduction histidine kinase